MTDFTSNPTKTPGSETGVASAEPGVARDLIVWAYRLFLDREPENARVVDDFARSMHTSREVRLAFLESDEFLAGSGSPAGLAGATLERRAGSMIVEQITDPARLAEFFIHVQRTWTEVGESEPHWSVMSTDRFKQEQLQDHLEEFIDSGRSEVEQLIGLLRRYGVAPGPNAICLEYGCGVGRVTRWLSERFRTVHARDISAPHLRLAREHVAQAGRDNVDFKQITALSELDSLPQVDLIYCIIVLQHNPPPIIEHTIARLARALRPGGVCVFQVPTYREGYSFGVERYLKTLRNVGRPKSIEMHVLPAARVYRAIFDAGCVPLDVIADGWAGPDQRSSTFIIIRPGG